jgi:site-specific DNA-cytosine methylase
VSDVLGSLPRVDAIIGGPPCPEFSRAKSDRTFDLAEVENFLKAKEESKADIYLMENVQDLVKVHKEKNFLVNCADYGVPQTRMRRLFTNLPLPQPTHAEFPSNTLFGDPLKKWVSVKDALGLDGIIEDRKTTFGEGESFREYSTDKPSNTLLSDARQWYISATGFKHQNQIEKTRSVEEPSQTIVNATQYQLTDHKIFSTKYLKGKNPEIYKRHPPNDLNGVMSTILAKDRCIPDEMITDGKMARKLGNEELAILQGFRKDFKFFGGVSSVRKQIGNAVPSAIGKAFFSSKNLINYHNLQKEKHNGI